MNKHVAIFLQNDNNNNNIEYYINSIINNEIRNGNKIAWNSLTMNGGVIDFQNKGTITLLKLTTILFYLYDSYFDLQNLIDNQKEEIIYNLISKYSAILYTKKAENRIINETNLNDVLQMKNYRLYLKKHITIFLGIHENDFYSLSDMRNLEDKNATDIGVFRKSIKELSNDNRVFTLVFEKRL